MNAATDLSEGSNSWGLTDIRTDSRLFDEELNNGELEWASNHKELFCQSCDLELSTFTQYLAHHIQHIRLPSVVVTPVNPYIIGRLQPGKIVRKRPGPKCKTLPENPHSPLKLTIKRLPTCHEPAFEVVSKKKARLAAMDEMIQEGRGEIHTPSPTPSEILRPEVNADTDRSAWESLAYSFGFLAPEPLDSTEDQDGGQAPPAPVKGKGKKQAANGKTTQKQPPERENKEDSGASSSSDPEPSEAPQSSSDLDSQMELNVPVENGISDGEPDNHKGHNAEQESSDSGCEKDESEREFTGSDRFQGPDTSVPLSPTNPSPVGSLTVLAPSALNSSVVNGSLPPEPLDSNTVSETFTNLSNESLEPPAPLLPPPVKEGLTILSPAALGATGNGSVHLLNLNNASNDPLGLLRGYMETEASSYMLETCEVCGDRSENLEQHRSTMGHYKCHMAPECGVVLFTSAAELSNHQHVAHGILAPTPSQPPSLQQLQQQVQRLPVPYSVAQGIQTPPPAVSPSFQHRSSPGYRPPGPITLNYPPPPGQTPPFQGAIQPRLFAMQTSPSSMRPDGSPVSSPSPTLPPGLSRSISISPSVKSAQKRTTPPPTLVESTKRSRPESPDCEFVDVQQKMPTLPSGISLTVRGAEKSKESSGVANILASRGITVTPAAAAVNKPSPPPSARASVTAQPVTTLNLSSAVSIVPANQARTQFAVPQGRSVGRQIDRQNRPPTVDLTQDSPPVFRRNRPQRFTCQVCDKVFTTQETLNQHLATHRSPGKLPYKCNLCNAQYPTQQAMLQHKQNYHKEAQGSEMALPVVDIKHPGTIQKLSALGIRHCLVLSQLGNASGGGVFGLPIVAIDGARNPAICNLGALGASNVLSLGPAKALR